MYVLIGGLTLVIGLLSVWQRSRLTRVNTRINRRMGKVGAATNELQSDRIYLVGGIFMVVVGIGLLFYGVFYGR